ncbi:hypothetical protein Mal4_16600 [Maioricimonas rarisocia]|uniref:Uncharacterized protein n=1 Tax=Maioricimonas rarisocia TaxID=2528026 RepID=A0A517Z4F4_9PLAN|nr:hypothetical protein [Maioricimonas rarisocia]QDU37349.1 hypothetical protein Mal4_16600 [Maioricimonas rarisocia]
MADMTALPANVLIGIARPVGGTIWMFVKRLVLLLPMGIAAAVITALTVLYAPAVAGAKPMVQPESTGVILVTCYAAAGFIWASHRAWLVAVETLLAALGRQSSGLIGAILAPLLARSPSPTGPIAIDDVRSLLDSGFSGGSSHHGLRNLVARRCLRSELAATCQALDALKANGEQHVTAANLSSYLAERTSEALCELARAQTRAFAVVGSLVVFLLLVGPVAVSMAFEWAGLA